MNITSPWWNNRVYSQFVVEFVFLNLYFSVLCFVDHCLSLYTCIVLSVLRFTTSNYPFWHFQTFLTPKTIVYHCFYYSMLINIQFIWIIILVLCHRRHLFFISGVYYLHQTFFTKIQVTPCYVLLKCL